MTASLGEAEALLDRLNLSDAQRAEQLPQTAFRFELARRWGIAPGWRLLELGCGQGDTTAVLASVVGEEGHVTAMDPASPDYGAPLTLGEATAKIRASTLGSRIAFRLGTDVLAPGLAPPFETYDAAVLAHCSWYFASSEALYETLVHLKRRTGRLLFSEWDIRASRADQLPHLMAVLVRRRFLSRGQEPEANIRSPLSRAEIERLLDRAGWRIDSLAEVESSALQDGRWEVEMLTADWLNAADAMSPDALATLRELTRSGAAVRSLPSYALSCSAP